MKLSITRIVLGILIIAAASYTSWWIFTQVPKELEFPAGEFYPLKNEILFNFFKFISVLIICLGIVLLVFGVFTLNKQLRSTNTMIIIQMFAGIFVVVFGILIIPYGLFPDYDFSQISYEASRIFLDFERTNYGRITAFFTSLFGATGIGISVAQLIKSRKIQTV